jgi:hypothetical protein
MNLGKIECGGVDWIGVVKDRDNWRDLVNAVIHLWVP